MEESLYAKPENVHELMLLLLDFTDSELIDDLWPDDELTLDDIAGLILDEHARELGVK